MKNHLKPCKSRDKLISNFIKQKDMSLNLTKIQRLQFV